MKISLKTTIAIAAICAVTIGLSGCDESALDFAAKTKDILDQRSAQLAKKIAAEKDAYNKEASHAAEDHRELVNLSLLNERNQRARTLASDYIESRKPISHWRNDLAEYAQIEYEANRDMLTAEIDANSRYLQNFEDLSIEQDKVEALSKLLVALSKKISLKSNIEALASFAQDTQQEFDKKVCAQLQSQKDGSDNAAKAAANTFTAKGCDAVLKAK